MLARADAALIIGDNALLLDQHASGSRRVEEDRSWRGVDGTTGLPFVYAFWAGRPDALTPTMSWRCSRRATPASPQPTSGAREYFPGRAGRQAIGAALPAR